MWLPSARIVLKDTEWGTGEMEKTQPLLGAISGSFPPHIRASRPTSVLRTGAEAHRPLDWKLLPMPSFCEVALPVPLDRTFTYALREDEPVSRGARVIAPFRNEKLIGVVTAADVGSPTDFEAEVP